MATLALAFGIGASAWADDAAEAAAEQPKSETKLATEKTVPSPAMPAPAAGFWKQHFNFVTLDIGTRFRYIDANPGRVTSRDQQYRLSTRLQIKLTPEGRSYFHMRGETGSRFNSTWSNTGMGLSDRQWVFNMKSFYFGQKLGNHFEAQVGGLDYERGVATEATSADNDGFLVGYRGIVNTSGKGWAPNKIIVTVGHLGDFGVMNAFTRMYHRMDEANFGQVVVQKALTKQHEASLEYNTIEGVDYVRGAYRWKKIPARLFDELQLEALSRATENATFGWSTALSKSFATPNAWKFTLLYSDVPRQMFNNFGQQILENGDTVALGKRMGGTMSVTPVAAWKDFSVQMHASRRLDDSGLAPRWRAQVIASYKLAGIANKLFQ